MFQANNTAQSTPGWHFYHSHFRPLKPRWEIIQSSLRISSRHYKQFMLTKYDLFMEMCALRLFKKCRFWCEGAFIIVLAMAIIKQQITALSILRLYARLHACRFTASHRLSYSIAHCDVTAMCASLFNWIVCCQANIGRATHHFSNLFDGHRRCCGMICVCDCVTEWFRNGPKRPKRKFSAWCLEQIVVLFAQ